MQINIKSLNTSKHQLDHYINKNNIDIVILSEIYLKPNHNFKIKNYKLVTSCRAFGYGGVGFLVKEDIQFTTSTLNSLLPIEALQITTTNLKDNLTLITVYISPNRSNDEIKIKFNTLIKTFNNVQNTIIAGDINVHNPLWGRNSKLDYRGTFIADFINLSNFIVLNNGDHTYISDSSGNTSAIDITLAHINIARDIEWFKTFETLDSDHFVLRINYLTEKINHQIIKPKIIINYKNLEVDILSIKLENIHTIRDFELILEDLLKKHTIQVTTNNKYVPKYWWNNYINNLWLIKTYKLKLFNKYKNDYTKIEYKKAKAKLKLNIKKSKKENFRQFINEINPNTSIKEIYSKIISLTRKNTKLVNTISMIKS